MSELGYIYIKHDATYGETLVVEGRHTRNQNTPVKQIPDLVTDVNILTEAGENILVEDGEDLTLDILEDAAFDNEMLNLKVSYGENIINEATAKIYPRTVSDENLVLFSLSSPISLAVGETKSGIKGRFFDSTGLATNVAGKAMLDPVATIDYLFNQRQDGTGSDLTYYLSVTAVYSSDSVEFEVTNTGFLDGYITRLQCRGEGIFTYDPIEANYENTASIESYGNLPISITMEYQDDVELGKTATEKIVLNDRLPKQTIQSVSFLANTNEKLMMTFLNVEVGDLIYLKEDQTGIDGYYFVQDIQYSIDINKIITFRYGVKEAIELDSPYWFLGVSGSSELNETTYLGW